MCTTLVEACNKYLEKHFIDVTKSDEFHELPVGEVKVITSQDELYVNNEEQVVQSFVVL